MFSDYDGVIKQALEEAIQKREDEIAAFKSEILKIEQRQAALREHMIQSMQAYTELGPREPHPNA